VVLNTDDKASVVEKNTCHRRGWASALDVFSDGHNHVSLDGQNRLQQQSNEYTDSEDWRGSNCFI